MEAVSLPLLPTASGARDIASGKARRALKRAARLMADADRFDRAAFRLEAAIGPDAWQVRHLHRQAEELRRLGRDEAAAAA